MSSFYAAVDVFSASTGATRWIWEGPQGNVGNTALAWSPDGSRLAMSNYYQVYLFDSLSGKKTGECRSPQMRPNTRYHAQIKDISWSPDGRYIVSTGDCIEIWDTRTSIQTLRYPRTEEDGDLNAVAWSPTDGRLASSSARAVHIWDALNAVQLTSFPHAAVFTLDWSPDGTYLASGGRDCLVRVWRT
jgi:WD40 repeat protein